MKGRVQLKDGIWYTVINYKGSDGKYKQKWETTNLKERGNKKEASRILEERLQQFEETQKQQKEKYAIRARAAKDILGTADMCFVDYCKAYIESIKNKLSPYTYYMYSAYYAERYKEYFKDKTVIDITSDEINAFNNYMKSKRGVCNNTLKHFEAVLKPALRKAFEDGIIPDNPYVKSKKIIMEKPTIDFYNHDELNKLFEATKDDKIALAIKMLAHYGFRRSELIGLRWKSIDFVHDTITINHKVIMVEKQLHLDDKLKTKASHRSLPLIPHIKEDLLKRKEQIEENKRFFGDAYDDKWKDYVFVDEQGKLFQPGHLTHRFIKLLKKHNLKHIRLHDLRHSCASLLLASKEINMKQIQDWLGHAKFSTTADVYSHTDYNSKMQSANVLAKAFGQKDESLKDKPLDEKEVLLTKIQAQMQQLGFTKFDEYFNYLEKQNADLSKSQTATVKRKDDLEM